MKKLMRVLFLSGLAVSLLAGCGNQEEKKEPEAEWTAEEKALFEDNTLFELPAYEGLSVSVMEKYDYILVAKSKDEAKDEDVEAYADKLEAKKYTSYECGYTQSG